MLFMMLCIFANIHNIIIKLINNINLSLRSTLDLNNKSAYKTFKTNLNPKSEQLKNYSLSGDLCNILGRQYNIS